MRVLELQLEELLDDSVGQHGYWLKNHREYIEEDLKSGIVRFGVRKMKEKLDDKEFYAPIYKRIEEGRGKYNKVVAKDYLRFSDEPTSIAKHGRAVAFIDRTTGAMYKAASWSSPAKTRII